MSVRAYRVEYIKRKEKPSFNLWFSEGLLDFLEEHGVYFSCVDYGIIDIPVNVLEDWINSREWKEDNDEYWVMEQIKDDIDFAKEHGSDYVTYSYF